MSGKVTVPVGRVQYKMALCCYAAGQAGTYALSQAYAWARTGGAVALGRNFSRFAMLPRTGAREAEASILARCVVRVWE